MIKSAEVEMTTMHPLAARPRRIVSARRSLAQVAILALALLWPAVASAQVGPLQTQVVVDRTYEAVVQIRVPLGPDDDGHQRLGFGSGTIISPAGYVLTNHHVIAEGSQVAAHIEIWRQEGPHEPLRHAFDATFVAGDPQLDLAVVRIISDANGRPVGSGFAFFPIGDFRALGVKITDPIDAIGFPTAGGQSITGYPGTVSGFAGEFDFRELFRLSQARDTVAVDRMVAAIPAGDTWIKTTAAFTGGISGGALLDGDGNLIGVPTLSLTALRLARPAILARPLLRDVPGVVFVERDRPNPSMTPPNDGRGPIHINPRDSGSGRR
jgi:serine protease Do